jgi:hypothetical protein
MTFSARTERRGQTINQLAAEKHLHKILDKPEVPARRKPDLLGDSFRAGRAIRARFPG